MKHVIQIVPSTVHVRCHTEHARTMSRFVPEMHPSNPFDHFVYFQFMSHVQNIPQVARAVSGMIPKIWGYSGLFGLFRVN